MENIFTQVPTTGRMKLKYQGYCPECDRTTYHRFSGGDVYETRYRCMKCKRINTEPVYNAPLTVEQKMDKDKRVQEWLELHGTKGVGDRVFDKQGMIVQIKIGFCDEWSITINPIRVTHTLGNGCGNSITIKF